MFGATGFNQQDIVKDGLVLWLDANDKTSYPGTGTVWRDLSRSYNNGTLTNGPTFNTGSGGSIVFDGVDDFVVAPSVLNLPNLNSNFTINIFTKPTAASYGNIFVLADSGYNNECQVLLNTNTILVTKYGGTSLITGGSISLNTWYNITYVQNNSVGFLYINGTLVQSNAITPQTSAISNIILGAYNTSAPQPYSGYTAIAQVYNRALSAAEITQNYNANKNRFGL